MWKKLYNNIVGDYMNKKIVLGVLGIAIFAIILIIVFTSKKENKIDTNKLEATVLSVEDRYITLQDKDNILVF